MSNTQPMHNAQRQQHSAYRYVQRVFFGSSAINQGASHVESRPKAILAILSQAEEPRINRGVLLVAALGFFTDSYNLFASNVVLPALSYVYWPESRNRYETGFNVATLLGSMFGQITFGIAADVYGRQALYGYELLIVVVSTLGLLQCSQGFREGDFSSTDYTWNFTPWLFCWRVVMGIGIGAEYPLSACIAAEWSSSRLRTRMMSAVFFMQPLGQLVAYLVGLAANHWRGSSRVEIDIFWRIVVGVGAAPTLLAFCVRWFIPESWRYTAYVARNTGQAVADSQYVYPEPERRDSGHARMPDMDLQDMRPRTHGARPVSPRSSQQSSSDEQYNFTHTSTQSTRRTDTSESWHGTNTERAYQDNSDSTMDTHNHQDLTDRPCAADRHTHTQNGAPTTATHIAADPRTSTQQASTGRTAHGAHFSGSEFWQFLCQNWTTLFGTSFCWFVLDFAFYGMGFMSPGTIAKLWAPFDYATQANAPWWELNSDVYNTTDPNQPPVFSETDSGTALTIKDVIFSDIWHAVVTTSIAAIVGSALFVAFAPHLRRRVMLISTFFTLSAVLAAIAGSMHAIFHHNAHWALVVLWAVAQFLFNFGPNTLIFILPAEVFPTRYRCTSYGFAAATGKLGAVVVQSITWPNMYDPNSFASLQWLLVGFSVAMALGGTVSIFRCLVPDPQDREHKDMILDKLSDDNKELKGTRYYNSDNKA